MPLAKQHHQHSLHHAATLVNRSCCTAHCHPQMQLLGSCCLESPPCAPQTSLVVVRSFPMSIASIALIWMQECVYHKAVMDKKTAGVLARLAKQASNLYGEASAMFNGAVLVQHFERSWVAHTQMKVELGSNSCGLGSMGRLLS
eukprot:GHUV01029233.1.p1 GENE.GHUV01029233.1~~GHUV01029233.1.p1  ORF type:complete len:144 (+),score=27.17 GHUV01029233.1:212-643(+)